MGMDEVLVAKMPFGFRVSKVRSISCFSFRSSKTASTSTSTRSMPSQPVPAVRSRMRASFSSRSIERFFTRPSKMPATAAKARATAASSFSRMRTGMPALAVT